MDSRLRWTAIIVACLALVLGGFAVVTNGGKAVGAATSVRVSDKTEMNALSLTRSGRQTFRYDTFGDETFWGDTLRLHEALEGEALGGVGPGVSPKTALAVGLKVDVVKLPVRVRRGIASGKINLNSPKTTVALLKLNAVVGVRGFFNSSGKLRRVGVTCALCHSTVDNSFAYGIGRRLDGYANRDLNVGAIVSLAPNLQPYVDTLKPVAPSITETDVRQVLLSWGPGKYDAELVLDGKASGPTTSGATMIPNAYDMAGQNLHTWTGFGAVPYWNAYVAVTQMHGKGTFYDPRLNNPEQFPLAVANGTWNIKIDPDKDRVTKKLAGLHEYQVALPSPKPRAGIDFNATAAARGDELFNGKAKCGTCHTEPLWTEPGHDVHTPEEMRIDSFQADRSPERAYKTMDLSGLFVRDRGLFMAKANRGRFYHDGRFKTLLDVVESYNERFGLGLTDQEMADLVQYLRSL